MSYNPYREPTIPNAEIHDPITNEQLQQQARSKLLPPGILLILLGSIGLLVTGAYFGLTMAMVASGAQEFGPPPDMTDEAELAGFYFALYGIFIMMGLNAFLQLLVILGGTAMVRGKGYGMAITGGVLSVIPCLSSTFCFFGIPFGIWALIVLSDPNVKRVLK